MRWKKLTMISVGFFVLLTSSVSVAADQYYLRLSGGLTALQDADHGNGVESDTFPDPSVGGAVGYALSDRVRVEAEIYYRSNTFGDFTIQGGKFGGSGDVRSLAVMGNGYYDFKTRIPLRPYLGVGLGWALIKYDVEAFGGQFLKDEDGVFAYQAMAGVAYEFVENFEFLIGYKFFSTTDPKFTDELGRRFDSEYLSHNAEVGLQVFF